MFTTVHSENHSSSLSDAEVDQISRALSIQATHHIAPAWGLAPVSVQQRERRPGDWSLLFLDTSDQAGALGYHDWEGKPVMKVFVADCRKYGVEPSACASHELAEAMCDPDIVRAAVDGSAGRVWAVEVGDPMQNFTYEVGGVAVQDFVLPSWFVVGSPGPHSYLKRAGAAFEVPAGGYAQYIDLSAPSKGWQSIGEELGGGDLDERPLCVRKG
jgi:hypothetical protein